MCRKYYSSFSSCNHFVKYAYGTKYSCPDSTTCVDTAPINLSIPGHCTPCLKRLRRESAADPARGLALEFEVLDAVWQRRVQQLLNLAPAPGERFRVFGARDYTYDSEDDDAFSGVLSEEDAWAIRLICSKISSYIMLPEVPDPPEEQYRFFDQLRNAELLVEEIRAERLIGRLPGASNRALWERLRIVMQPVPVTDGENQSCDLCYQVMPAPYDGDFGLRLPCGHAFGKDCLERWIMQWVPGHAFNVCPACRRNSDLLSVAEQVDGIDGISWMARLPWGDTLSAGHAAGAWLQVIKDTWNA